MNYSFQTQNNEGSDVLLAHDQQDLLMLNQQMDTTTDRLSLSILHNKSARIYLRARYYLNKSKNDSAVYHAKRALIFTKGDQDYKAVKQYIQSLQWLMEAYYGLGNEKQVIHYCNSILDFTNNVEDASSFFKHRQAATSYKTIILAKNGAYSLAINEYQKLFDYMQRYQIDRSQISSIVYLNISRFYIALEQYELAEEYALKAKAIATTNTLNFRQALCNIQLAEIALHYCQYEHLRSYLKEAYKILKDSNYKNLLLQYYIIQLKFYDQLNDQSKQLENAKSAYAILRNKPIDRNNKYVLNKLIELYHKNKDYQKALEIHHLLISKQASDEIHFYTIEEIMNELDYGIKRENPYMRSAVKSKKQWWMIICYSLVLFVPMILIIVRYWINIKIKPEITTVSKNRKSNKNIGTTVNSDSSFILHADYQVDKQSNPLRNGETVDKIAVSTELNTSAKPEVMQRIPITEKIKVLIIDDSITDFENVKEVLGANSCTINTLQNNFKNVIDFVETYGVDMLILPLTTSNENSSKILQQIKTTSRYAGISIISVIETYEQQSVFEFLIPGLDDYIMVNSTLIEVEACFNFLVKHKINCLVKYHEVINVDEREWIYAVREKMKVGLENPDIKIGNIINTMYISHSQFVRRIKKITGLTPKGLQTEIAMQEARKLLIDRTYHNTSAVAYSVGYKNVTRFSELYKKRFGVSPFVYF